MDRAAEFCELTGQHDLLAYLGLKSDVVPEDAVERLRDRRRLVQGMKANVKYAQEARFLMRHFGDLELVLSNPAMHLEDMRARRIRFGMPTMVSQIQAMLRYGDLSADQLQALRDRAGEMGFSASDFRAALEQAGATAKPARSEPLPVAPPPVVEVAAPPPPPEPEPPPVVEPPPEEFPIADTRPSQAEPLPDLGERPSEPLPAHFGKVPRQTTATTPIARADSPKPAPIPEPDPAPVEDAEASWPPPPPAPSAVPAPPQDPLDEPTPIIPALQPLVQPAGPAVVAAARPMWEESWFRATGAVLGVLIVLGVVVALVWVFAGFSAP